MLRLPLAGLVAANAISLLGNVVAAVAIPWFVLETTGSAARTGVAAFFATLPLALGALAGGAVADRLGARSTSVLADVLSGAAVAGIPLLHALDRLEFWHVLALAFVGALFDAPGQAAREALLPAAADAAGVSRERANAAWTTTEHVGYVLGAPLAGLAIAAAGAPAALWLDAASFAASAAVVAAAVPRAARSRPVASYLSDVVEGLRYLAAHPMLRPFLVVSTIGNFIIAPLAPVFLPVYARDELGGAAHLGILVGAYGAGGLAGAGVYWLIGRRVRRRPFYVALWVTYPILCALLIALPPLPLAAAVLVGIGACAGAFAPLEQLIRQEHTPPELRGRVFASYMASLTLAVPPAVLAGGLLVEALGLRAGFAVFAAANAVLQAYAIAMRAAREL